MFGNAQMLLMCSWVLVSPGPWPPYIGNLRANLLRSAPEVLLAIAILMLRRNPSVGGELGGPRSVKTVTAGIFVFFAKMKDMFQIFKMTPRLLWCYEQYW